MGTDQLNVGTGNYLFGCSSQLELVVAEKITGR